MEAFLGVDVSKGYADFILLNKGKNALESVFQLDDTREGHTSLEALLKSFISEHRITQLYCGVESTGGFENNWYGALSALGGYMPVKVARLNPSGVKSNARATLKRNVTDALSARYVAEYLTAHPEKIDYTLSENYYVGFRSLHKHINLLKKQNTQLINELKSVLYSAFPEVMRYCKQSVPVWVLSMLEKYPTAHNLAKVKAERLSKTPNITLQRAQTLINKAKHSVASRPDQRHQFLISSLASQIKAKQLLIEKHKKYLEKECRGVEVSLLESIKGIGSYSAAAIMIEIEDIKRFPSAKALVSYFGLHPELKNSGDKQGTYRMSKKGRASVRATLFMCAKSAVLHDEHMKSIYHRHRQRGKGHRQAIGVIMHKLLRIVWGVLTSGKPYDKDVDKANQQGRQQQPETSSEEINKKRRYQAMDEEAPISRRQTKTRKAHQESQVPNKGERIRDHLSVPLTKIK